MARKPDSVVTLEVPARDLHSQDAIICRDGSTVRLHEVRTRAITTTISARDGKSWSVDAARIIRVRAEHGCDCNGSGVFHGRGYVENGVFKGTVGVCFGCGGKGWRDRADAIRCSTYWNKDARISA